MIFFLIFLQLVKPQEILQYPLVLGQPSYFYLKKFFTQPIENYYFEDENEYELDIVQPITEVSETQFLEEILSGTNYMIESGFESNYFYIITKSQNLYSGVINFNGQLNLTQFSLNISILSFLQDSNNDCIKIMMITDTNFLLLCINQDNYLEILYVNQTANSVQNTTTNYIIQNYETLDCQMKSLWNNTYQIQLSYINSSDYLIYQIFNYYDNQITPLIQISYMAQQIGVSDNLNLVFVMTSDNLTIYNTQGEMLNIYNQTGYLYIQFIFKELPNQLIEFVLVTNQSLQIIQFDLLNNYSLELLGSSTIQMYETILYFEWYLNQIYFITNNYISLYSFFLYLQQENYYQLENATYCLLNDERKLIIIQQNLSLVMNIITEPFIYIAIDQVEQLSNYQFQLIGNFSSNIQYQTINFQTVNTTTDNQPILAKINPNSVTFNYPHQKIYQFDDLFYGPNISIAIESSNSYTLISNSFDNMTGSGGAYTVLYYQQCGYTNKTQLSCTQNPNFMLSLLYQSQTINIQKIKAQVLNCVCELSKNSIIVAFQFSNSVFVTEFDLQEQEILNSITYPFSSANINVNSIALLQQTLFVVTNNSVLTAYEISSDTTIFEITNYQIQNIFINPLIYPHYLFFDNLDSVLILGYKYNHSLYEVINEIQYPIANNDEVFISIFKNGILLALVNDYQSMLYCYQPSSLQLQLSTQQQFFQIDLYGQTFQSIGINALQSINQLFIPQNNSGSFNIYVYQPYGTAYNTLLTTVSQKASIQWLSYQNLFLETFLTNSKSYSVQFGLWAIKIYPFYSTTTVQFELILNSSQVQYTQQISITNSLLNITSNQLASNNVTLRNAVSKNVSFDPSELFTGILEYLSVDCINCSSIKYQTPISDLIVQAQIMPIYATTSNNQLYILSSSNVYLYNTSANQFNSLLEYDSSYSCSYIFIEIITNMPVSICYSDGINFLYSINQTNQQILTYSFSETNINVNQIYNSSYNSGILQIFVQNKSLIYQYSYFVTIVTNIINLEEISFYSQKIVSFNQVAPIYFSLLNSNQELVTCPVFGFSIQGYFISGINIVVFKSCMSQQLANYFGISPTNCNSTITIIYQYVSFITFNNFIYQFLPYYRIIQIGQSTQTREGNYQVKLIFYQISTNEIVNAIFSQADGSILYYYFICQLYVPNFSSVATTQLPLFSVQDQIIVSANSYISSNPVIYLYDNVYKQHVCETPNDIVQINGYQELNQNCSSFSQCFTFLVTGNYIIIGINSIASLQLYYIQNNIQVNLTTSNTTGELIIQATNGLSEAEQQCNWEVNLTEPFINDENDETIIEPDSQSNKFNWKLTIIITISIIILIILTLLSLYFYKKYKPKQQQQQQIELDPQKIRTSYQELF